MARSSRLGRADRFFQNPILRDQEWERTKQAPWWLTVLAVAVTGAAFLFGVYSGAQQRATPWIIGIATIVVYVVLGVLRRGWARRRLRQIHGQPAAS